MHAFWVTEDARLRAMAGAWGALCDRAPGCSPFARPEWLLPWRQVFGGGRALRVLAVEDAGQLIALFPLHEVSHEVPAAEAPALALMGGDISDHHDAPVAAGREQDGELREAVARALDDLSCRSLTLDRLRADSWLRRLGGELADGAFSEAVEEPPCPTLSGGGGRTLSDLLPAGFAHRLGRQARKGDRAGRTLRHAETVEEALFLFDALSAFHAQRWQVRGEPGVLADPDVQRFHRLVIPGMQRAGLLRLYAMELGGVLAAVVYAFAAHRRLSFYLSGFDARQETASPGVLAIAGTIERELAAGVEQFDFLRGREPYKYRFGAQDAACFTLQVQRADQISAGASVSSRT